MNNHSNIREKRAELKAISQPLAELKATGNIQTINEGLKSIYQQQGHHELKTFEQWERAGMHVKRGAKAVYLWGKQTAKTIIDNGQEKEIKYFPLVALFSDSQVYNPQNYK
ncbi:MAG: hypothetical protein PHV20_12370 [Bacteroidales bacterium]|nr:hypothetical protein [Bacteroidales bacterium]